MVCCRRGMKKPGSYWSDCNALSEVLSTVVWTIQEKERIVEEMAKFALEHGQKS